MRRLLSFILASIFCLEVTAQVPSSGATVKSAGAEYFVGAEFGKPLITVHLLSGVRTPGVYHVPMDTDLAELIAYAGGATERADLGAITLRRQTPQFKLLEINLADEMKVAKNIMPIHDRDVIRIEQSNAPERTLTWVSIIASIASVILSMALIDDIRRRN